MIYAIANLRVTLVDCCEFEPDLKRCEDGWFSKMGSVLNGLNNKNEILNNRRNWGHS